MQTKWEAYLVPWNRGSLHKARGHFVCWRGVTTNLYLDIWRRSNEASAQKGPEIYVTNFCSRGLEGIDDEELSRVFGYQSVEGPRFKNSIEELFTQLFGHSLYHRGQIASYVRSLGGEPAVTDFVYWARVPG